LTYQFFEVHHDNGTAWVHINRTDKRNALCRALLEEAIGIFHNLGDDPGVRVIVLTGNGKTFVAGADIQEMSTMTSLGYLEYGKIYSTLNSAIRDNPKPVIGAINGVAFGGGTILALSCDVLVASEQAKFALPEIHLGIFGGGALMPKLVGRYRASEMILTGDAYSAADAFSMGFVNKVVPAEKLYETTRELVEKIKTKSPSAVRLAKQAILNGFYYDFHSATNYQQALMAVLYGGHDQKEGMEAFLNKRTPVFTGK
jgi:enoyl-CoA hydratase